METVKVTAIYAQAATNRAERDAALTPRPRRRFIPLVKPEIREVSKSFYLSCAAAFCKHKPYILISAHLLTAGLDHS